MSIDRVTDRRAARRAAERAARDAIAGTMVVVVGDLSEAEAARSAAAAGVDTAHSRAREYVAEAEQEAARMVEQAQEQAAAAQKAYAAAYAAAVGAGWSEDKLDGLGYTSATQHPRGAKRRRGRGAQPSDARRSPAAPANSGAGPVNGHGAPGGATPVSSAPAASASGDGLGELVGERGGEPRGDGRGEQQPSPHAAGGDEGADDQDAGGYRGHEGN